METPRHRYELRIARNIKTPEYGPKAYMTEYKKFVFPFGKKHNIKTGDAARSEAMKIAVRYRSEASEITIYKMNGNGGMGWRIKDEDTLFGSSFPEECE